MGCEKECIQSDKCDLVLDSGRCYAAFIKYYFDKEEVKCKEFTRGACGTVVPFYTFEECEDCK